MNFRAALLTVIVAGTAPAAGGEEAEVAAGTDQAAAVAQADVAAGETLYQDSCRNCHGPKAQGLSSYPKLSDKDADYLQWRLEQYRAGERIGPNSALMIPNARDLSDEDIADIVAYITTTLR